MNGLSLTLAAVSSAEPKPEDVATACATGCAGCGMLLLIVPAAVIALHVCLLVWVAKDSKSRGMHETVGWLILVALTGLIGLIVYVCVRSSGDMARCAKCNRFRLVTLPSCPNCRN